MDSGLPDPLSSTTTINMQPAFVYSSGIFPRDVSSTFGFGVDTTVPSTGDSSLLSARTTSHIRPTADGTCSLCGWWEFWVGVNALGLTYSEASGPPNFWAELCGTPSTTCVPTVARSPWGHLIAACLLQWQGQATIPASGHISGSNLNPNAWVSLSQVQVVESQQGTPPSLWLEVGVLPLPITAPRIHMSVENLQLQIPSP